MDGRHVQHDMVAHIMQTFADAYAPARPLRASGRDNADPVTGPKTREPNPQKA
jgi:hypothetical protein